MNPTLQFSFVIFHQTPSLNANFTIVSSRSSNAPIDARVQISAIDGDGNLTEGLTKSLSPCHLNRLKGGMMRCFLLIYPPFPGFATPLFIYLSYPYPYPYSFPFSYSVFFSFCLSINRSVNQSTSDYFSNQTTMSTSQLRQPHKTRQVTKLMSATISCSKHSAVYGKCILANHENMTKDACLNEFLAYKQCVQKNLGGKRW